MVFPILGRILRAIDFTEDQKLSCKHVTLRYLLDIEIDLSIGMKTGIQKKFGSSLKFHSRKTKRLPECCLDCVCLKQYRAGHIWEARTHLHVASAPYLLHLHSYFPDHNLSLFPCLLPPLTFQGNYYKYSFQKVFFAHFGCLRRPVVMALSRGIFLRKKQRASSGIVSFSTEKVVQKQNRAKQPPSPSFLFL